MQDRRRSRGRAEPRPIERGRLAKVFQILFPAVSAERGSKEGKSITFRPAPDARKLLQDTLKEEKLSHTDAMDRALAGAREQIEEAGPHAYLFAYEAEREGISPQRAIVRLAMEALLKREKNTALQEHLEKTKGKGNK